MAGATARVLNVPRAFRRKLFDLISAADCPERFLAELGHTVGMTDDLRAVPQIEGEEWRKVIRLAPAIWARKGEHEVLRDIVRMLVKARSWIGDWHSLAWVTGSLLPIIGTASLTAGAKRTVMHVEDFDGTLNRDLTMDALDIVRGIGEQIDVVFAAFIENWDNLFRWDVDGDATISGNQLLLDGSLADASATTVDPGPWADRALFTSVLGIDSTAELRMRIRETGVAHYEARLTQGPGPNNVVLARSGIPVATATYGIPDVTTTNIIAQMATFPTMGPGVAVQIIIDGTTVINYIDATPIAGPGGASFEAKSGNGGVVSWFDVLDVPPEIRTIPV
jgi:hypothetical protein